MNIILENSGPEIGIPMMFPVTWEENVAANMRAIPLFELFPGLLVKTIYKAYRYGVENRIIEPWRSVGYDVTVTTVRYLADVTSKKPVVILDLLNAMLVTVAQGKADPGIITATAITGIEEKIPAATGAAAKAAAAPLTQIAIIAAAGLVLYAISIGMLPKPKRT